MNKPSYTIRERLSASAILLMIGLILAIISAYAGGKTEMSYSPDDSPVFFIVFIVAGLISLAIALGISWKAMIYTIKARRFNRAAKALNKVKGDRFLEFAKKLKVTYDQDWLGLGGIEELARNTDPKTLGKWLASFLHLSHARLEQTNAPIGRLAKYLVETSYHNLFFSQASWLRFLVVGMKSSRHPGVGEVVEKAVSEFFAKRKTEKDKAAEERKTSREISDGLKAVGYKLEPKPRRGRHEPETYL